MASFGSDFSEVLIQQYQMFVTEVVVGVVLDYFILKHVSNILPPFVFKWDE